MLGNTQLSGGIEKASCVNWESFRLSFITGNQHCISETEEIVLVVVKHVDNRINEELVFFSFFSIAISGLQ